jgi:hypothetical protein
VIDQDDVLVVGHRQDVVARPGERVHELPTNEQSDDELPGDELGSKQPEQFGPVEQQGERDQ